MVLHHEELQGRLGRSESFNQELQQTIKRERVERSQREQRITELELKIQASQSCINIFPDSRACGCDQTKIDETDMLTGAEDHDCETAARELWRIYSPHR